MAFRTDLAQEALTHTQSFDHQQGIRHTSRTINGFIVDCVEVLTDQAAKALYKPCGTYCTLTLDPLTRRDSDAFPHAVDVLSHLLRQLLPQPEPKQTILVIGLGNRAITPDAIGPLTIEHILVTRHLKNSLPDDFCQWQSVSAAAPGVLGQTGMEAAEFTRGLCDTIHPHAIVVIDALSAGSLSHLGHTIQLTDAGIVPGSGVGNARSAFDKHTFGVPVIAIGLPTVTDGASIVSQVSSNDDTLEQLSGPFFVTPRDIDQQVRDAAKIIGYAVNCALQPHLSLADLDLLLS